MSLIVRKGKLNGIEFTLKPRNPKATRLSRELAEMILEWHTEHNKEFMEYDKKHNTLSKLKSDDPDIINQLEDMPEFKIWQEDVDFREEYYEKKADACMEMPSQDKEFWRSDELDIGTIDDAFDFFTGARSFPKDG